MQKTAGNRPDVHRITVILRQVGNNGHQTDGTGMNAETFANSEHKQRAAARQRAPGAWDIPLATAIMAAVLLYAWTESGERHLTAEEGVGYWLGIIGAVMMLLLLVYPLRKRLRALRFLGAVPGWFRIHMLFGVVGPSLVILHSNFTLGSLNSQVALFSMLTVAGSGYIGRFLYQRIHRGLSGRRRSAAGLRAEAEAHWQALTLEDEDSEAAELFLEYERKYMVPERSLMTALIRMLPARRAALRIRKAVLAEKDSPLMAGRIEDYYSAVRRAQMFFIYERLFALWHLLHLPLFIVLIAAALLHVFAVHLY